jgi:hypothetical protein
MIDPIEYYHLERFLFERVRLRFQSEGSIGAFDFFSIVIWKANRAKSMVAKRLKHGSPQEDLEEICRKLSKQIFEAPNEEERMRVLLEKWGFRLPMASAILTILYPDVFTAYDVRAAEQLGYSLKLQDITRFDKIWQGYRDFRERVHGLPQGETLRDKDRHLFGKSLIEALQRDLREGFVKSGDKQQAANDDDVL